MNTTLTTTGRGSRDQVQVRKIRTNNILLLRWYIFTCEWDHPVERSTMNNSCQGRLCFMTCSYQGQLWNPPLGTQRHICFSHRFLDPMDQSDGIQILVESYHALNLVTVHPFLVSWEKAAWSQGTHLSLEVNVKASDPQKLWLSHQAFVAPLWSFASIFLELQFSAATAFEPEKITCDEIDLNKERFLKENFDWSWS